MRVLAILSLLFFAACGSGQLPEKATQEQVHKLELGLLALDQSIDPKEAARAAEIAYSYTAVLAEEYQITDTPIIHNMKVNAGVRPRGLCWHWADDLEARLEQENFRSFDILRAIANSDNPFRIEHSTTLLAPRGGTIEDAMVLDPWRFGGRLYWGLMREDDDYNWLPREMVFAQKRAALSEVR